MSVHAQLPSASHAQVLHPSPAGLVSPSTQAASHAISVHAQVPLASQKQVLHPSDAVAVSPGSTHGSPSTAPCDCPAPTLESFELQPVEPIEIAAIRIHVPVARVSLFIVLILSTAPRSAPPTGAPLRGPIRWLRSSCGGTRPSPSPIRHGGEKMFDRCAPLLVKDRIDMPSLSPSIRSLGPFGAGVLLSSVLAAAPAWSVEVGDAEVTVERAEGASDCPGEDGFKKAIERVGTQPEGPRPSGSLTLDVRIQRVGDDYRAEIHARGRKTGLRTLEVPGPTCSALTDAVAVTLAILMDREIREDAEPLPEEPPKPEPVPTAAPIVDQPPPVEPTKPARSGRPRASSPISTGLGLSLGGAMTHGLPLGWSGMATGGFWVRHDRLDVGVSGFWAPAKEAELEPGSVDVRLLGVQLRACGRVWGQWQRLHLAGCAEAAMAQLQGQGQGYATDRVQRRPWYALGASARLGMPILGPIEGAISAGVLAPLQQESFSVDRVGQAYETDVITFFVGPQLLVQIL